MGIWSLLSSPEATTFIMFCNWQSSQTQELKSALKKNPFQLHLFVSEITFFKGKEEEWQKQDISVGHVSDLGTTVKEQFN